MSAFMIDLMRAIATGLCRHHGLVGKFPPQSAGKGRHSTKSRVCGNRPRQPGRSGLVQEGAVIAHHLVKQTLEQLMHETAVQALLLRHPAQTLQFFLLAHRVHGIQPMRRLEPAHLHRYFETTRQAVQYVFVDPVDAIAQLQQFGGDVGGTVSLHAATRTPNSWPLETKPILLPAVATLNNRYTRPSRSSQSLEFLSRHCPLSRRCRAKPAAASA